MISENDNVAKVISSYPFLADIFLETGFKHILNPAMLKTVANKMTLKMVCRMKDVDLDSFVKTLNNKIVEVEGGV